MLTKEQRAAYNANYYAANKERYAENYAANKKPTKSEIKYGELKQLLAYISQYFGGKDIDAMSPIWNDDNFIAENKLADVVAKINDGWSNIFVLNQDTVADTLNLSKPTLRKYLSRLIDEGELLRVCTYRYDGSVYANIAYITKLKHYDTEIVTKFWEIVNPLVEDNTKKHKSCLAKKLANTEMCQTFKTAISDEHVKYLVQTKDGYAYPRLYSELCATANPERHPDDNSRYELLSKYYGIDNPEEIDVTSCILRTNYNIVSILTGRKMMDMETDPYFELYKATEFCLTDDYDTFRNKKYNGTTIRDLVKSLVMPCFMKPQSLKYNACALQYEYKKLIDEHCMSEAYVNEQSKIYYARFVDEVLNDRYNNFVMRFKKALYKFLAIDENTTFLPKKNWMAYESGVYIYMLKKFRELNIKCANVYDGFYFEKGTCTKELFYEVYNQAIIDVVETAKETNFDFEQYYVNYDESDFTIGKQTSCKIHTIDRRNNMIMIGNFDEKILLVEPVNYDYASKCYVDANGDKYIPTPIHPDDEKERLIDYILSFSEFADTTDIEVLKTLDIQKLDNIGFKAREKALIAKREADKLAEAEALTKAEHEEEIRQLKDDIIWELCETGKIDACGPKETKPYYAMSIDELRKLQATL